MANRDGREALRGAEEQMFDVMSEVLTPQQWAELLKAPLEHAAAKGKLGLAQKLMEAGAEIGDALHVAVGGGHSNAVSYLLENGASVSAKDTYGRTPLHCAAESGETEILQQLLLKGADKGARDNNDRTPLLKATGYGHLPVVQALLAAGADVNARCGQSNILVVHLAIEEGRVDMLRAMIRHGADVEALDFDNGTACHVAAVHNEAEAIDVLVEAGANIEAPNDEGFTPLHVAGLHLRLEAAIALLKHGAKVNARDVNGDIPLQMATCNAGDEGTAEVVDLLLRSGADETIVCEISKAAADIIELDFRQVDHIEDFKRVCRLLANAPADRAWRRRGYLVLCRAHPDRVHLRRESSVESYVGMAPRTRSIAKLMSTETTASRHVAAESSTLDERTAGEWVGVLAKMLRLPEEGIFRGIVGYL